MQGAPAHAAIFQPVFWDTLAGAVKALRLPAGQTVGTTLSINDRGDAVGTTGTCANTTVSATGLLLGERAVLWRNGAPTELGSLAGGISVAGSIDLGTVGDGQITGGSCGEEGNCRAFLLDPASSTMVDLNDLVRGGSAKAISGTSPTPVPLAVQEALRRRWGTPPALRRLSR